MPDFGTLSVTEVILHRVPQGRRDEDAADTIDYAEATTPLGPLDRGFVEGRLRETLDGAARPIIEDEDDEECKTPAIVRALLDGTGDIVEDSSELARALHRRQKWISPTGLLMVILGELGQELCVIIAKMEHEEGMRVEAAVVNGKRTYKAQYLKDLILGQGTKVFKVGVFGASGARPDERLTGHVVDVQQGAGGVADYFVDFLGCQFLQRPDVLTEKFFNVTQTYASSATKGNAEATAEYEIALLSEMQNQSPRISPELFAQRHLKSEHRDAYLAKIRDAGLPAAGFPKDTALVANKIRRVKIQTGRGASIFIPPTMYDDGSVSVETPGDSEFSTVVVQDKISSISGASGPKKHE